MMEDKFTKKALVTSQGFSVIERDILNIILDDDKQYTLTKAKRLIKEFKGGISK